MVVWEISGHFRRVYQSHKCASDGEFLFSFVYVIYLNIASDLHGKQIKKKLGLVGLLYRGLSSLERYFSHIPTWKQEIISF